VDHIVVLQFDYFDEGPVPVSFDSFLDGPWCESDLERFDVDVLRIRHVRVVLRVEAALDFMRGPAGDLFWRRGTSTTPGRFLPDRAVSFDIAPRSLNADR
jgi:hypothetical protein